MNFATGNNFALQNNGGKLSATERKMEFQIVMHRGPGMRHGLLGLVVATAMTAAPSTRVSSADDVDKGKALAARLCAACHMNEGQGEKLGLLGVPGFAAVACACA